MAIWVKLNFSNLGFNFLLDKFHPRSFQLKSSCFPFVILQILIGEPLGLVVPEIFPESEGQ